MELRSKDQRGLVSTVAFLNNNRQPIEDCDGVCSIDFERDDVGRIQKCFFRSKWETPAVNVSGLSGHVFGYNEDGLCLIENVGVSGSPVEDVQGLAAIRLCYTNGLVSTQERYDAEGMLTHANGQPAVTRRTFDSCGRLTSECYYDSVSNYLASRGIGATRMVYQYESMLSPKPCKQTCYFETNCLAHITYVWDVRGLLSEWSLLDPNGKEMSFVDGTSGGRFLWSQSGCVTNVIWRGEKKNRPRGCAMQYNKQNLLVDLCYYGDDGKIENSKNFNGCPITGFCVEYNEYGDVTRCQERHGGWLPGSRKGTQYSRNEYGKPICVSYFVGQDRSGVTSKVYDYDDVGMPMVETFFRKKFDGSEYVVTNERVKVSRIEWRRDLTTGRVDERYFDALQHPMTNHLGYSRIVRERGSNENGSGTETYWAGNTHIKVSTFDNNGFETNRVTSSAEANFKYDVLGRATSIWERVDGKLREVRCEYYGNGFERKRSYWNTDGTPLYFEGYHARIRGLKDEERVCLELYFDENEKPIQRVVDGISIWGILLNYVSDDYAYIFKVDPQKVIDPSVSPYTESEWDLIEKIAIDCVNAKRQGHLIVLPWLDGRQTGVWRGCDVIDLSFLSDYGKQLGCCVHPGCVLIREYSLGVGAKIRDERKIDEFGQPQMDSEGWREVTRSNQDGTFYQMTEYALPGQKFSSGNHSMKRTTKEILESGLKKLTYEYLNEDGSEGWGTSGERIDWTVWSREPNSEPIESHTYYSPKAHGCSNVVHEVSKCDEKGRTVERVYLDKDDKPTPNIIGSVRHTYEYLPNGDYVVTDCAFDGGCLLHVDGLARKVLRYDKNGREIEELFQNAKGQPHHDQNGIYRIHYAYDKMGQEILEDRYRAPDGTLMKEVEPNVWHIQMRKQEGKTIETLYYDKNEHLIRVIKGRG